MKIKFHQWCWGMLAWSVLISCADAYKNTNIEIAPKVTDLEAEVADLETGLKLDDDSDGEIAESINGVTDDIHKIATDWIEKFKECMSIRGYRIQNLALEIHDSMDDVTFRRAVDLCGVETGVLSISQELLRWYSESVENMTPSQIQAENTMSVLMTECIEKQGWDMKLVTEDNGLLVLDQQHLDNYYRALNPKIFSMLTSDMETCIADVADRRQEKEE